MGECSGCEEGTDPEGVLSAGLSGSKASGCIRRAFCHDSLVEPSTAALRHSPTCPTLTHGRLYKDTADLQNDHMFMDMHAHTLKAPIGPLSHIDFEHHGECVLPSSDTSVRSMVSAYSIQQNGLIHLGLYTKVHGL